VALRSDRSVFESDEADGLARWLAALADPQDRVLRRVAMAGPGFGFDAAGLQSLAGDVEESWHARFGQWQLTFQHRGALAALTQMIEAAAPNLLALIDGARRLTNLRHLVECVHSSPVDHHDPGAVAAWLERARRDADEAADATLRPDGEADAVRVMTVHKSKGLQFGIVFQPFAWAGTPDRIDPPVCVRDADTGVLVDLGSADLETHRARARQDLLAEQVRVCYVAFTRARHRNYVVFAPASDSARSGLGRVLHGPDLPNSAAEAEVWEAPWRALSAAAQGAIQRLPLQIGSERRLQERPPASPVSVARMPRHVDARWRLVSFSGLRRDSEDEAAAPVDHDRHVAETDEPGAEVGGAVFGECFHAVMQHLDTSRWPAPEARAIIDRQSDRFVLGPADRAQLTTLVEAALEAALVGDLTYRRIPASAKVAEMGFAYPVSAGTAQRMARVFDASPSTHHLADTVRAAGDRLQGMMRGFIDLCFEADGRFHLLDWKTNRLGEASAYREDSLPGAMRAHAYDLQAWIYALALHRFLRWRQPARYRADTHLGDAVYVFVRGLRHGPRHGRCAFPLRADIVEALDAAVGGAP
jgi:exodeoxyribonuclease V beta subunit